MKFLLLALDCVCLSVIFLFVCTVYSFSHKAKSLACQRVHAHGDAMRLQYLAFRPLVLNSLS